MTQTCGIGSGDESKFSTSQNQHGKLVSSSISWYAHATSGATWRDGGRNDRRFEQLLHPRHQIGTGVRRRDFERLRIAGCEMGPAMAASNAFSQIVYANLEPSAAGGAFLNEIRITRHGSPPKTRACEKSSEAGPVLPATKITRPVSDFNPKLDGSPSSDGRQQVEHCSDMWRESCIQRQSPKRMSC